MRNSHNCTASFRILSAIAHFGMWAAESRIAEVSRASLSAVMWKLASKISSTISGFLLGSVASRIMESSYPICSFLS